MNITNIWCVILSLIIIWEAFALRNQTRKRNLKKHKIRHGHRNNSTSIRRKYEDPLDKLRKEFGKFGHHGKIETYYDPYWESGEWVFLRITTRKGDAEPTTTTLIPGVTPKKFRKWPMSIYRDCDLLCLNIYKDFYGAVCAQRYNTMKWRNEYKTFENMCELERENCKLPEKRPMWYPIHREKYCDELSTFKLFPTNYGAILSRKTSWAPYEYLRTEIATPGIFINVTSLKPRR